MTLLASEFFNTGTAGNSVPATSPWTKSNGTSYVPATYNVSAAAHGALGARFSDVSVFQYFRWSNGSGIPVMVVSYYMNWRTMPGALVYMHWVNDAALAKVSQFRVNQASSGASTVTITNSTVAVATSTQTIVANTWYRVEHTLTASSTAQELKVFAGEAATPLIDLTGSTNGNQAMTADIGVRAASTSGGAFDLDTMRISDTPLGPFVSSTPYEAVYKKSAGTQLAVLNRML